jgi:radical SAM superfamily enzyme YgiQ (UPF0313 family)/L-ascorbate metabolism protein UlaG (beta-lactamase superfamily)
MHVALLFPPVTDPRAPHLAIPSLAASLRRDGIRTTIRDLNIEGLLWLLEPAQLARAAEACRARLAKAGATDEYDRIRQILARASYVVEHATAAAVTLRERETFYDPDRHHEARGTVRHALALISAASGRVRYDISNPLYEVEGVDRSVLRDLVDVTADPHANLFHQLWEDHLLRDLEADRPDLVGVSILNGQQIIPGLTLCRRLRERGHEVVIGGTVFAKFVEVLLRRPEFFRLFCTGLIPYEGEAALRALVSQIAQPDKWLDVPNFIHLDASGAPVIGPTHVESVDTLPTPDFDGLPLDQYLAPAPVLPILTGKGCYFNRCKFCDIPYINKISGKAYRIRSAERIADDIATLHRRHDARHFVITDEALSPKLLLQLADAIAARADLADVRPRFVGYARLERGFTPEVCRRLHEMGIRKLFFGLESGSQETLDHMDKGVRIEDARGVLQSCKDAGIAVHVFSIIGFPQESEASARATLAFFLNNADLLAHPRNSFDIHYFGLDLRTEYYENATAYRTLIDESALRRRDFPISVNQWTNSEGLGEADVKRLLAEFDKILREVFRGTRIYPQQHWPGFEEYAILYGTRYEAQPFLYRTALPPGGAGDRFRLQWAESVRFGPSLDGSQTVWGIGGSLTLGSAAVAALTSLPSTRSVDDLIEELIARIPHTPEQRSDLVSEMREVIDALLAERLLWYRPEPAPGEAPAVHGPRGAASSQGSTLRFRCDVELRVEYEDRSRFGAPVGPRPDQEARRLYGQLLAYAREHGVEAAMDMGPEMLRASVDSSAFREIATVSSQGWALLPDVLYPDPASSLPRSLRVSHGATGAELVVDVPPGGWSALGELIAGLSNGGVSRDRDEVAGLLDVLESRGFVEPVPELRGKDVLSACQVTFLGHNTVSIRAGGAHVVLDPFFLPADPGTPGYRPIERNNLGAIDAVLVTHAHPDHFDPGSLLRCGRDAVIVVPRVERESILTIDFARRLRELGFPRILEMDWGEVQRIGELEIHALPFFGEQPTSGAVLHPEVRNHGNTYVLQGPELAAAFVADAGRDRAGDIRDVARTFRSTHGPVDIVFAGYRGWFTYPTQLAFTSVPRYLLFVPPSEWRVRQQLMNDAVGAVDLAELWGASWLIPYGAGGAPWYWTRGLGPRLDGLGQEDPSFDPWPERGEEAAARRVGFPGGTWMQSSVQVRVLRPGDGIEDVRSGTPVRRLAGHAWPWVGSRIDGGECPVTAASAQSAGLVAASAAAAGLTAASATESGLTAASAQSAGLVTAASASAAGLVAASAAPAGLASDPPSTDVLLMSAVAQKLGLGSPTPPAGPTDLILAALREAGSTLVPSSQSQDIESLSGFVADGVRRALAARSATLPVESVPVPATIASDIAGLLADRGSKAT